MTDKLQEYAQLLINVGLNVQKDQYVVISSQVDCAYLQECALPPHMKPEQSRLS